MRDRGPGFIKRSLQAGLALLSCAAASGSQVQSVSHDSYGATVRFRNGVMRIDICTERIAHVVVSPTSAIPPQEVPVVIHKWKPSGFNLDEKGATIHIDTGTIRVTVDRPTGAVSFQDTAGRTLLQEAAGGGRTMIPETILGEETWKIGQVFQSPPDEVLYGLGQHQEGFINIRGIPLRMQQVNTEISVPVLLSNKGYGLLWDNASVTDFDSADEEIPVDLKTGEGTLTTGIAGEYGFRIESDTHDQLVLSVNDTHVVDLRNMWVPYSAGGKINLAANTKYRIVAAGGPTGSHVYVRFPSATTTFRSDAGSAVDYYFFYGPDLNRVIADYRFATGEAPLFPKWAYGFWQCRERYSSQEQILEVAKQFRERHIPVDVLVQDWQYWGRYGWNAMRFDEHYPHPREMINALHDANFRFVISVWSKFGPQTDIHRQFAARGLLIPDDPPDEQWMDVFNPEAEKLFWADMKNGLFDEGVDGWWLDATEPEGDPLKGKHTFLGPGDTVRNAYPLYVTGSVYKGQRSTTTEKRVVILTRSAFAGQQRNAAASWSGDIGGNWETLRRQIPAGLGFSMSGLPYWTTDIGGFFRPPDQYTSEAYHELLIRWFQYGSFCPLFRIHGYKSETEMWKFGPRVESVLRMYDQLRYRLLPYIYSSAWGVTHDGKTLMRALPMDYGTDPKVAQIPDQFMFGPALMINPVTEANATARAVYLPNGTGWIDFWTGEKMAGGQPIRAAAPLDRIPIYVKAGSIVPMGPVIESTTQTTDPVELRVYPGRDASFVLYDDESDGYNYEKGIYSTIGIEWNDRMRLLTIGKRSGAYRGMSVNRKFNIIWVRPNTGAGSEPSSTPDTKVEYKGNRVQVHAPND